MIYISTCKMLNSVFDDVPNVVASYHSLCLADF